MKFSAEGSPANGIMSPELGEVHLLHPFFTQWIAFEGQLSANQRLFLPRTNRVLLCKGGNSKSKGGILRESLREQGL